MGGTREAAAAANASISANHKPDLLATRTSNSRRPRAIASTGATRAASRAGDQAESRLTPAPTNSASVADDAVKAIVPGRLVTYNILTVVPINFTAVLAISRPTGTPDRAPVTP